MSVYHKSLTRQQYQSDCGVACLLSIIRYFGGDQKLEKLRELSGTSRQGTTVLGLVQAAPQLGLEAKGLKGNLDYLKKIQMPVILHVIIDNRLQHYVICYAFKQGKFILGDPAKGIREYTPEDLEKIWQSQALIQLQPNDSFVKAKTARKAKIQWFWELLKEDISLLTVASVLGIAIAIIGLSMAIFSQKLIDDILPNKDASRLWVALTLLGVLLTARMFLSYLRGLFLLKQSLSFNQRMIDRFYAALLYLPKAFFDHRKTGDLIARMNDTHRIQQNISLIAGSVLIDGIVMGISTTFIFFYSLPIGFWALFTIPLYLTLAWKFNQKIIRAQQDVMEAYSRNESNYIDTMQGIATIKGAGKEAFFSQITRTVYAWYQQKIYQLGFLGIRFGFWIECLGLGFLLGMIAYAAQLVLLEELQIGEMMALLTVAGSIVPAIGRLIGASIALQEARVAFERMYEFAALQPEFPDQTHSETSLEITQIKVENLSFRFTGRKPLLKDISFEANRGEMIAILGESGCGKSTLMQILQRFYPFEQGQIQVNQQGWLSTSTPSWRSVLGVVNQETKIFNGTLLDNIILGETSPDEAQKVISFCQRWGFDTFFEELPQAYACIVGEEGINLSGGQKQLLALARALYGQPQILLLDELFAAMDRNTETFVMNLLQRYQENGLIILVTHKIHIAKQADRIYLIEDGQIKHTGKHKDLIQSQNLYSLSYQELIASNK